MSVVNCACPKCRQPLQVAQALPARVKCPKCAAVFTISAPARAESPVSAGVPPARPAPAPPGAPTAIAPNPVPLPASESGRFVNVARPEIQPGPNMGIWILTGVGLLTTAALAGVLVVVLNSSSATSDNDKPGLGHNRMFGEIPPDSPLPISAEDAKVKQAVDKGVAYLKKKLLEPDSNLLYYFKHNDDPHIGAAALAGMTLVECGVPPTDPAVQRAIQLVRERKKSLTFTYSVALSILFLDRLTDPDSKDVIRNVPKKDQEEFKTIIRSLALQLVANQHVLGGWNYYTQLLTPADEKKLLQQLETPKFKAGGFKPPPDDNVYRDNSISQFAILALWAARKTDKKPHGIPVEKTLLLEDQIYRQEQNPKDGSWDYNRTNAQARDATTCAGLICLAIGHAIRDEIAEKQAGKDKTKKVTKKLDLKADDQIKKALDFISRPLAKAGVLAPQTVAKRKIHTEDLEELWRKYFVTIQAEPLKKLKTAYEKIKLEYHLEKKKSGPNSPKTRGLKVKMDRAGDDLYQEAKASGMLEISDAIKELDNRELPTGMIIGTDAWGDLYFLWSLERVAMIYGLKKMPNGTDWYKWGKDIILKNQQSDGSWRERFPGVPDTCFALLFLQRINIVKDLADKLRQLMAALSGSRPGQNAPPEPGLPPPRFEA